MRHFRYAVIVVAIAVGLLTRASAPRTRCPKTINKQPSSARRSRASAALENAMDARGVGGPAVHRRSPAPAGAVLAPCYSPLMCRIHVEAEGHHV